MKWQAGVSFRDDYIFTKVDGELLPPGEDEDPDSKAEVVHKEGDTR